MRRLNGSTNFRQNSDSSCASRAGDSAAHDNAAAAAASCTCAYSRADYDAVVSAITGRTRRLLSTTTGVASSDVWASIIASGSELSFRSNVNEHSDGDGAVDNQSTD